MKLVTVAEMQAIEREANMSGFTYEMMMENAGTSLAEVINEVYVTRKTGSGTSRSCTTARRSACSHHSQGVVECRTRSYTRTTVRCVP